MVRTLQAHSMEDVTSDDSGKTTLASQVDHISQVKKANKFLFQKKIHQFSIFYFSAFLCLKKTDKYFYS